MTYSFEKILTIRKNKEDNARNLLMKRKAALEDAKRKKKKKQAKLVSFTKWRVTEEVRLFDQLKGRQLEMADLDQYTLHTIHFRRKQYILEKQLEKATQDILDAEKKLVAAKNNYLTAQHEMKKFEEHKKLWVEEQRILNERLAEKEMEEFAVVKRLPF